MEEDWFTTVSGSAFCQRRQQLKPELFKDENDKLIDNVYKGLKHLHKYNGKTLLAADTSIITLSNHTITKEKYGIKSKIDAKNTIPRARMSCITDTLTNMIVSADLNITASSELKMAVNQINELENIIDLENSIIMGDGGYDSLEMMIKIIEHNSHFIIRLKDTTFINERKNLTGDDEYTWINMNKKRLKNVDNKEIKEKYLIKGRIQLRILRILLGEDEDGKPKVEYLITNLPKEIAPYEDFKELYHQKWSVETEFDRLKNIHEIENFSG